VASVNKEIQLTSDNLVRIESFIREAFVQKQHAVAILFDLQKADDTTWKHGIIKDLFDAGLRGQCSFLASFRTDDFKSG